MNDKVEYWIELADYDIETAKVMLDGKRYLYVGFMCHQTIEKAIKSVISNIEPDIIPPKTHNLIRLANLANILNNMSNEHQKLIETLNPLNIDARYPEYKNQLSLVLTSEKCKEILKETKGLLLWIKQQL